MSCRRCRSYFTAALYGELSARQQAVFQSHLESCPACAAEFEALSVTLKVMDRREPLEPAQAYWEGYWQRLLARLNGDTARSLRLTISEWLIQSWESITAGILIGRFAIQWPGPVGPNGEPVMSAAALQFNQDAYRYLDRAKTLLTGIQNVDVRRDDLRVLDIPRQQLISQELLQQARELRNTPQEVADSRIRELVEEIELVLLPLANSEGANLRWTIHLVQEGIARNAILLKITLTELDREQEPASEPEIPPAKRSAVIV
jgi:hypothetical protein